MNNNNDSDNNSNNNNNNNNNELHDIDRDNEEQVNERILQLLKRYFGLNSFRPNQLEIIKHTVINGGDSFVSIATGGGKSLCFQLPSLILNKTTIVISPLKSLISDQTLKLNSLGIRTVKLSSDIKYGTSKYNEIFKGSSIGGCNYSIIFITPERIVNEMIAIGEMVEKNEICLFAIDECHCISQWGHDFRPSYKRLDIIRSMFSHIPIMALTATSTKEIEKDVLDTLQINTEATIMFKSLKNRENIYYKAITKENEKSDFDMIYKMIESTKKSIGIASNSTIIYCPTIVCANELNKFLVGKGTLSNCYHSQLTDKQRDSALNDFLFNKTEVIVATIAFGMGIDKPDIRLVIHYGPSKSVEEYYQESGRAGRDGLPALSLIFYNLQDFVKSNFRLNFGGSSNSSFGGGGHDKLSQMKNILVNRSECRRKNILAVFDEVYVVSKGGCGACDNCCEVKDTTDQLELGAESNTLIRCIHEAGQYCGMKTIIDILRGSKAADLKDKHKKNSHYGKGVSLTARWWKELANQLKSHGYLTETYSNGYTITKIDKKGWDIFKLSSLALIRPSEANKISVPILNNQILRAEYKSTNHFKQELIKKQQPSIQSTQLSQPTQQTTTSSSNTFLKSNQLDSNVLKLFSVLVEFRKSLSELTGVPQFLLFSETSLRQIATIRPSSIKDLSNINGLDEKKIRDHGYSILLKVKEFTNAENLSFNNYSNNNNNINNNNDNNYNNNTTTTTTITSTNTTPLKIQQSPSNDNNTSTIFKLIKGFNLKSPPSILGKSGSDLKRKISDSFDKNNDNEHLKKLKTDHLFNNNNNSNNNNINNDNNTKYEYNLSNVFNKKVKFSKDNSQLILNAFKEARDNSYRLVGK